MADRRIKFECACGQHLVAKRSMAGTKIHCPSCSHKITIPDAGIEIDTMQYEQVERYAVVCSCGNRMLVKAAAAEQTIRCSRCARSLRVPSLELLRGGRTQVLEDSSGSREQIHTEDLLLLVDDDEGPGEEIH